MELFNVDQMSPSELDRIAINNNGVVGTLTKGGPFRGALPDTPVHGYGFRWVNTRNLPDEGTLILTPKSGQALKCLRSGFVKALRRNPELNMPLKDFPFSLNRLYMVARKIPSGFENNVLRAVITMDTTGLSPKRLIAVEAILEGLRYSYTTIEPTERRAA